MSIGRRCIPRRRRPIFFVRSPAAPARGERWSSAAAHYPDAVSVDPVVRDALLVTGCVLGVLAVVLAVVALLRLRRLRRDYALLHSTGDEESFLAAVARKTEEVAQLRSQVDDLAVLLDRTRSELADALRHVSVVRYDAFGDLGGRLSFSAALLDDSGDGLVLTSIHGRAETRSYIKGVKGGGGDVALSPEEQQAIAYALRRAVA